MTEIVLPIRKPSRYNVSEEFPPDLPMPATWLVRVNPGEELPEHERQTLCAAIQAAFDFWWVGREARRPGTKMLHFSEFFYYMTGKQFGDVLAALLPCDMAPRLAPKKE